MMKLLWKLRILLGPVRPFLGRKIIDGIVIALDRLRLGRGSTIAIHEGLSTNAGVFPLPSADWFQRYSADVVSFARQMRQGKVNAYGITNWKVGDDDPLGVDVRSTHELSRMHHWCAYALAVHIEPERADVWCSAFEHELRLFASTYTKRSVHWRFPMGTAIRVFSMLVAWDWIRRSGYENADTDRFVAACAAEHGMQVYLHRESKGGLSTSHFVANLLGLAAVEAYVQGNRSLAKLSRYTQKVLEREAQRQILPDGMVQEASTGYHRQVIDLFVMIAVLRRGAGKNLSASFHDALSRGLAALDTLESIGMPLIGDNDDGMALKLTGYAPRTDTTRYYARYLGLEAGALHNWTSYPDFGLDIWRGSLGVTLRNGSVGQFGKGGHAHHDQNSITVCCDGHPIIIDPGTSLYTFSAAVRNTERSVQFHSTMWPADQDQGYMYREQDGLFWLPAFDLRSGVSMRSETRWYGEVHHRSSLVHARDVTIQPHGSIISCIDTLRRGRKNPINGELVFVLAPDIQVRMAHDHAALSVGDTQVMLEWQGASGSSRKLVTAPRFAQTRESTAIVLSGNTISWRLRRS